MFTFLLIAGLIWFVILFLDTLFKSCLLRPYFVTLRRAGMEIYPLMFVWTITRYNRVINRIGFYQRDFLKVWFQIGAVVTCITFFPCLFFYVYKLVCLFYTDSIEEFESSSLVPVVPGYNFPLTQWKTYFSVILICSVFHEFGHAVAASRLRIPVDNFGFAVLFVAPVAFVNVRLDQLKQSSLWQQMTVFCAGIWHNIILSLTCLFVLNNFWLFAWPLFSVGDGVTVYHVNEQSGLNEPVYGFTNGDCIHSVGNCTVNDLNSWNRCLDDLAFKFEGFCVAKSMVNSTDYIPVDECAKIPGHLYFYMQVDTLKFGVCLSARTAVDNYKSCIHNFDCDKSSVCLVPLLPISHKFIVLRRLDKGPILYDGYVSDLTDNVRVSELLPRLWFLGSGFAEEIREFIQYLLIFSNGLACLNVLPISTFDGVYIAETFIHFFLYNYCSYYQREWYAGYGGMFALGVTVSLVCLTFYKLYIFYP